jgi:hypothetical protein
MDVGFSIRLSRLSNAGCEAIRHTLKKRGHLWRSLVTFERFPRNLEVSKGHLWSDKSHLWAPDGHLYLWGSLSREFTATTVRDTIEHQLQFRSQPVYRFEKPSVAIGK